MSSKHITILGSPININGGDLNDHLISMRIFTLIMNTQGIQTRSKNHEANGCKHNLDLQIVSY